jgi:hypothetical protein
MGELRNLRKCTVDRVLIPMAEALWKFDFDADLRFPVSQNVFSPVEEEMAWLRLHVTRTALGGTNG